jgi:hypothetical protein
MAYEKVNCADLIGIDFEFIPQRVCFYEILKSVEVRIDFKQTITPYKRS